MKQIITVYHDFLCPFCYIGSRSAKHLEDEFGVEFEWIGWELMPELPPEGSENRSTDHSFIIKRLAYNLNLRFSHPSLIANTNLALRGAEYAKDLEAVEDYLDAVYHAYWVSGINISTMEQLKPLAEAVGLDGDDFEAALSSGQYGDRVLKKADAVKLDIRKVPTFVFDGHRIVGNVPFSALREAVKVYALGYESIL